MAIRQAAVNNSLSKNEKVYQMKKNIGAVLYHCTNFPDQFYRHVLCPVGPDSWCKWKKGNSAGNSNYTPKVNLPVWIYDIIKKDFEELSDDNLLRKCTHGQTQNSNEGLNSIIWSRCQKTFLFIKLRLSWK